jgi:hypothetical protein
MYAGRKFYRCSAAVKLTELDATLISNDGKEETPYQSIGFYNKPLFKTMAISFFFLRYLYSVCC